MQRPSHPHFFRQCFYAVICHLSIWLHMNIAVYLYWGLMRKNWFAMSRLLHLLGHITERLPFMSRLLHLSGHIWKNLLTMSRFSSKRGCLGILFLYMSRLVLFPGLFTSLFLHMSRVSLSPGLFTSLFLHMSKTPPKTINCQTMLFKYISTHLSQAQTQTKHNFSQVSF